MIRVLLLLMLASPALADDASAVAVAERAAAVHERWCSEVAAAKATKAYEASAEVAPALAEVSRAYDRDGELYLLYWRGLLGSCQGQEDRAIADLQDFVAKAVDEVALADQVEDARKRLRRLGLPVGATATEPVHPVTLIGASLMGGGAALGALAGWQGSEVARLQTGFQDAELPWNQRVEAYAVPGETAAQASNGLLGSAIAVGTGGAVALIVSLATQKRAGPVAFVLPRGPDGFTFALGGAW